MYCEPQEKTYAGRIFKILICRNIINRVNCIGFASDTKAMCIFHEKMQECRREELDNFDAICQQYLNIIQCANDARCKWGNIGCTTGEWPKQIPFAQMNNKTYPPYNPKHIMPPNWSRPKLPSSVIDPKIPSTHAPNKCGTDPASGCRCSHVVDNHGLGEHCTANPAGDGQYYCVVEKGACCDEMRSYDNTRYFYSFAACKLFKMKQDSEAATASIKLLQPYESTLSPPTAVGKITKTAPKAQNAFAPIYLAVTVFALTVIMTVSFYVRKSPSLEELLTMNPVIPVFVPVSDVKLLEENFGLKTEFDGELYIPLP